MYKYFFLFLVVTGVRSPAQQLSLTDYIYQQALDISPATVNGRGFSFLDTLLQGKRIVALGESSHGTEEYSQLKEELIRYQTAALPATPSLRWVQQMATANSRYYARLTKGDQRDSGMAQNIIWLAEQLYPNDKIIV